MQTYVRYLQDGGPPRIRARRSIAAGGLAAADAAAVALRGNLTDNHKTELVLILQDIEMLGTNLKGTRADAALRELANERAIGATLRQITKETIGAIDDRERRRSHR